jgi:ABC-2 type transport system ATP-binding protein
VAAIDLDGVTRRFGDLVAVDEVTFSVSQGEIVGLLGHNGAGKTTLLRVINGLLPPDSGGISVLGHDPVQKGEVVRARTGVLTEYPALDEYLSTTENLAVYAAINGVSRQVAQERIETLTEQLGLAAKRDVPARDLSAGLKQRVALARALVHDPEVLLLDEPTTNMDPVAARGVRDLIRDAARRRGRTVLLSTHNLGEAEELCDRIGILRNGQLLSFGPPTELRRALGEAQSVHIEVDADQVEAVRRAIDGLAEVRELERGLVEIVGGPPVSVQVSRLVAAEVAVHRVEPQDPTLEDLYLHLHGKRQRTEVAS